jgi:hypothetical protein
MRRDLEAGGKWVCTCDARHEIHSLIGLEKMLDVWPLVREIRETEDRLHELADGPERHKLQQQYVKLSDKLADMMAKPA